MDDGRRRNTGRWSVVSTVRAPGILVAHFVEHHLALGADRVHLYFDDPEQTWRSSSVRARRVDTTVCTADWWERFGERPGLFEQRQLHNVEHARRETSSEWLLHIDVDEYVAADRTVSECLAGLESNVFSVVLPPAEAVYEREPDSAMAALATPWFRIPSDGLMRSDLELLYGESADLPRNGVFGHLAGKTFVRVGMETGAPAVHRPRPADRSLRANLSLPGLSLLHFHALDFADWLEKWQRRAFGLVQIKGQQALRLTETFRNAFEMGGSDATRKLYRQWYVPDRSQLQHAEAIGLVRRLGPLGHQASAAAAAVGLWDPAAESCD